MRPPPDRDLGKSAPTGPAAHSIVQCIALDEFIAEESRFPTVVKDRIEGSEVEVLRGANVLCSEYKPTIVCEFHSEENRCDVERMLGKIGYSFLAIDSNHLAAVP